jgi:FtsZ-interacting cell division protein ZipA
MAALRWILLLAGLVFLGALTIWELRRQRQSPGDESAPEHKRSEPALGPVEAHSAAAPMRGAGDGRRRLMPPVQIDLPSAELSDEESTSAAVDALPVFDFRDGAEEAAAAIAPPSIEAAPLEPSAAGAQASESEAAAAPMSAAANAPLIIDWPPDGVRHIVSLRIVSGPQQRLSGRAVRLAITASGFVHGRFGIYHQPGLDGRSLLSVASLNKPGILDPANLDFQRLTGISLFTVLPGPLPPAAALDHLLHTARDLSERLQAQLQDEDGHELNAERLESLRESMQRLNGEPAA